MVVLMPAASSWAQMVAEYLSQSGLSIHVVDFNSSLGTNSLVNDQSIERLRQKVAGVHMLTSSGPFPWRTAVGAHRLRRLVRSTASSGVLALYGGLQAAIAWASGVRPYIVYVVGSDVLLADRTRRFIAAVSLRRAARILSNGEYLAAKTAEMVSPVPVEPLYFGIDLQRFRPEQPVSAPRFVCTRVFHQVYNNDTIVRAVSQLGDTAPDFAVEFLSSGPLLGPTRQLADDILAPSTRAKVRFAGGVSDEELLAALRAARFYLSASRSDGASASLLEGMACGLFPIVTDIPANREWIRHGENGLLFPAGDHVALSRAMTRALEGAPWIDAAVAANLELVRRRADVQRNLERLTQLIGQYCGITSHGGAN